MAIARMLHKKISISQQVNKLSINARLLFTWLIAHADDEGRLRGEANYIRASVVPLTNWSSNVVEKYLVEMSDLGLIYRWQEGDECLIEFVKWGEYQKIPPSKSKQSQYPPYPQNIDNALTDEKLLEGRQFATQYNVIQSETNEEELNPVERSSTNEVAKSVSFKKWADIPTNPDEFKPKNEGELAAKEAWLELEPENKTAFKLTYMRALYLQNLPPHLFYEFVSDIKQDPKVRNSGAVFNKKVKEYSEKRKEAEPTNFP